MTQHFDIIRVAGQHGGKRPAGRGGAARGLVMVVAWALVALWGAADAPASVPLELKDGRTFQIVAIERDGATVTITTDRGVRFPMRADRIVSPEAAWTTRIERLRDEGRVREALENARLLRIWDPTNADSARLLGEIQGAVHGDLAEEFRRALQGSDFDTVKRMLAEAETNEDLQRYYVEAVAHQLSGRFSALRPENLDMTSLYLEKVEALGLRTPDEQRLRARIEAMRAERRDRAQRHEDRQRELHQATLVQNTLTQAMSFSAAGQFDRARAVLDELTPELRANPEVVRTRELVDAQEVRGRRGELLADLRQHRRLQQWGASLRLAMELASKLPDDPELARERDDAVLDHRRAVGLAKANQQQSRGVTMSVAARPGLTYQLYLPWSYEGERGLPAIWAFSGGGPGTDMVALLELIANHAGYVVVAPNGPLGSGSNLFAAQDAIVDDLRHRLLVDERRSVAAGHGAGGGEALALAMRRPSIAPVVVAMSSSAAAPPGIRAEARVPILFLAGQDDPAHFNLARPAADAYRRLGHPVELVTFPGASAVPPPAALERALLRAQEMSAAAAASR